ncbi:siderophore-interacting protein [Plantibacter sp. YIM 135347]|uniref:siderophore-interacting protein n=1 Tax=Plantibacter sp. YIM 135347 TaxID=3423919 RepID=UPI003D350C00
MRNSERPIWYLASVITTHRLSSRMMRVTLGPAEQSAEPDHAVLDLDAFVSSGRPDEFVTLLLPTAGAPAASVRSLLVETAEGTAAEPSAEITTRYYSIRRWDPLAHTVDIDFVLHGHGPAASWALNASPGETIALGEPRGHHTPPADTDWIALVGDATALPAIARILEFHADRPDDPPITAVIDVGEDDEHVLAHRPQDRIVWMHGSRCLARADSHDGPDAADLPEAVRALTERDGIGYVWFSGEASQMRTIRSRLRHTLRLPTARWQTMAYWRKDAERWRRRYEQLDPATTELLEAIYTSEEDDEVMRDRAEAVFVANGL